MERHELAGADPAVQPPQPDRFRRAPPANPHHPVDPHPPEPPPPARASPGVMSGRTLWVLAGETRGLHAACAAVAPGFFSPRPAGRPREARNTSVAGSAPAGGAVASGWRAPGPPADALVVAAAGGE